MSIQEGKKIAAAAFNKHYKDPEFDWGKSLPDLLAAVKARALKKVKHTRGTIYDFKGCGSGIGYGPESQEITAWEMSILLAEYAAGTIAQKAAEGHCPKEAPCSKSSMEHLQMLSDFKLELQDIGSSRFLVGAFSQFGQHTGEDFQTEILLIPESIGPSLDGPDLVVEALDETQRHLVLLMAIRLDAVPVAGHHRGELVERIQPLPPQRVTPLVEESPCPSGAVVVPQLSKGFLEEVGLVQPLVGFEQPLEGCPALGLEVSPVRQQCVPLPLDEPPVRARQAGIFPFTHLVHRFAQVLEDVELVVQDGGLRRVAFLEGRVAERWPHVHDRQTDLAAFSRAEPGEELVQARFGAVLAAEPDGPAPLQVADDDAVSVPLGNGDLVDANDTGSRRASPSELLPHVLLIQLLDGVPIEEEFLGHLLEGGVATASANQEGEPLGVQRVVGEPVQPLVLHATP